MRPRNPVCLLNKKTLLELSKINEREILAPEDGTTAAGLNTLKAEEKMMALSWHGEVT
jgi:hypothetical protein